VLEGNAFGLRDVVERLRALGVATRAVRLLGGGARSRLWAQVRADVTGLPVECSAVADAAAVGAALLAAVASAGWTDLAAAARQVGAVAMTREPQPAARSAYNEAHARYRRLFGCLRPMFE
jgi:xylulokinase